MNDAWEQRKEAGRYHRQCKYKRGFVTVPRKQVDDARRELTEYMDECVRCGRYGYWAYRHENNRCKHNWPDICPHFEMLQALQQLFDRINDKRLHMVYKRGGRRVRQRCFAQAEKTKKVPRPYRGALRGNASNAKYIGYKRVIKCRRTARKRRLVYKSEIRNQINDFNFSSCPQVEKRKTLTQQQIYASSDPPTLQYQYKSQ